MHQNVSLPSSHLSSADISLCGWAGILSPSSSSLHNWFSMGLFGSSSPFCKGVYSFPPLLFQPRIEEEVCVGDTVPHNVNATSGLSHGNQAPEPSLVCARRRDMASFFPLSLLGRSYLERWALAPSRLVSARSLLRADFSISSLTYTVAPSPLPHAPLVVTCLSWHF